MFSPAIEFNSPKTPSLQNDKPAEYTTRLMVDEAGVRVIVQFCDG
jgi:hypothetical protein